MPLVREVPVLADQHRVPADEFGTQLARLDDRVQHEVGREAQQVDVLLVLGAARGDVGRALVGIAIGSLFAWRAARGGGDAGDQALAYFLPGLLYNAGYTVFLALSAIVGWPLVGFLVGSVTGDPTAWHSDRAIVRLCSQLTWILALPCLIRVVVQGPVYLAGHQGWWATDTAVGVLGGAKLAMGWPLQVAAFAAMAWLLGRNHTPLEGEGSPDAG